MHTNYLQPDSEIFVLWWQLMTKQLFKNWISNGQSESLLGKNSTWLIVCFLIAINTWWA